MISMGKMHAEGVTLIEFLVTIGVLAIITAIGAPMLNDLIANSRMSAAVNDVVTTLHLARSEAVKRRTSVTICPSLNADSAAPSCAAAAGFDEGWIAFADDNANATVDANEVVVHAHGPLPETIADNSRWSDEDGNAATPFYIAFAPSGFRQNLVGLPAAVAHLQLCDHRGDHDHEAPQRRHHARRNQTASC